MLGLSAGGAAFGAPANKALKIGHTGITWGNDVELAVKEAAIREGMALVSAMHITAGVFINDNETGFLKDLDDLLGRSRSVASEPGPDVPTDCDT